jgi:hypothetical protein
MEDYISNTVKKCLEKNNYIDILLNINPSN